jgi:hypothetical protein
MIQTTDFTMFYWYKLCKINSKGKLMKLLSLSLLFLFSSHILAFNKCEFAKSETKKIQKLDDELKLLESIHRTNMEDPELRTRLKDSEDVAEVGVLAEQLDLEVKEITGQQVVLYGEAFVSTGALVAARLIIKKLKKLPKKHKMRVAFHRQMSLSKSARWKVTGALNFASIMLVATDVYLGYRMIQNSKQKKLLASLIVSLNKIEENLSEKIIPLRRELTARIIELDELLDELIEDEELEIRNDRLICL